MALRDMVSRPERTPEQPISEAQPAPQPTVPAAAPPPAPALPPQSSASAASTFLDASITFEGVIRSDEPLRIDGRVKGEIHCEQSVVIGESARVEAAIRADAVVIAGEVRGEVHAARKITLAATARVVGELTTPGIVIEEGAELVGRIQIGRLPKSEPQPEKDAASADGSRKSRLAPPPVTPSPPTA